MISPWLLLVRIKLQEKKPNRLLVEFIYILQLNFLFKGITIIFKMIVGLSVPAKIYHTYD